ncbi:MAG: single-stranded DNA-binding protein [Candidatus Binatia bacterium]
MAEYNKVILMGNLTREPELRYTPTGMAVCEFPMAVHHRYRAQDEHKEDVCYIDVVVFGRGGENSKEHLHKGSRVLVDGRLTQRRWETPEGHKRSKYEVVAHTVQFVDAADRSTAGDDEDLPL